jgi:hypothetical protein
MDGVTNDVERSNEMVSVTNVTTVYYGLWVGCLFWSRDFELAIFFQVSILQEQLEAKDLELARLKETLSQKEGTQDAPVEERDEAGDDQKAASDPLQVKVES